MSFIPGTLHHFSVLTTLEVSINAILLNPCFILELPWSFKKTLYGFPLKDCDYIYLRGPEIFIFNSTMYSCYSL